MKGVILIPCSKTIDAARVAKLFPHHVFKWFSLHDSLISNRGPQFASAFARELAQLLHYNVKLSITYHPQTDRQTEWTNQEIETHLHIFCANNPWKWMDFLPTAEFHHNSVPHSSTKVSPFSLLHGYEPRVYPPLGKTFLPALENCLTTLEEAQKEALAAHETTHRIMKEQNTWNFFPWKVGDKVWLEATNLHLNYPSRKLAPKWQGPFEISQVLSSLTYCLCLPTTWKIHNVFHASLLSFYKETKAHGLNFSKSPPDLIGTEEEYEVEQIVSHQGTLGCRKYLTTWKGYPSSENTWEPESNLCHASEILSTYKWTHQLSCLTTTTCLSPQPMTTPPSSDLPMSLGSWDSPSTSSNTSNSATSPLTTPKLTPAFARSLSAPSTTKPTGSGISSWVPPCRCTWPPQHHTQNIQVPP